MIQWIIQNDDYDDDDKEPERRYSWMKIGAPFIGTYKPRKKNSLISVGDFFLVFLSKKKEIFCHHQWWMAPLHNYHSCILHTHTHIEDGQKQVEWMNKLYNTSYIQHIYETHTRTLEFIGYHFQSNSNSHL